DLVEAEALGVGLAADRDEDAVGGERLAVAAGGGFERERGLLSFDANPGDLAREAQLHALLLEQLGGFLAYLAVHAWEERVKEFDHHDFGAETAPDRAELEPDH